MISKKLADALSSQINKEFASSYLYLGMATHFENEDLPGMASWMRIQAQEELEHGMKIYDYMLAVNAMPELNKIDAVPNKFGEPSKVFEAALEHEQFITKSVNDLYELASNEKDYKTMSFLQWFINEQVEEEANVNAILGKFKHCDGKAGLMLIDRDLGQARAEAPTGAESQVE